MQLGSQKLVGGVEGINCLITTECDNSGLGNTTGITINMDLSMSDNASLATSCAGNVLDNSSETIDAEEPKFVLNELRAKN